MSGQNSGFAVWRQEPLPWDWREKVLDFLKPEDRLLELSPGDHTFLRSLRHSGERCAFLPQPEGMLPFAENSFDLVLNSGGWYDLSEVYRVLKPGGFFLLQQFGGEHIFSLRQLLSLNASAPQDYNLENQLSMVQKAGFRIMYRSQAYSTLRFSGAEEVLAYLPEQREDFRARLEQFFADHAFLETEEHLFLIIGKKRAAAVPGN